MGFPDYVEKNILAPLGMASSSFAYRADLADRYAKGPAGRNWVGIPAIRDMPAGSLNASAEDMGRFLTAVMRTVKDNAGPGDGGILDPPSLAEMWTRQNAKARFDFDFQVGLGWWPVTMDLLPGTVLYGHGGDLPPFQCLLLVEPKAGIGIAIMVNSAGNLGSFSLAPIADEILRSFAMAEKGVTYPEPDRKPKPATALPEELAKRLEGNWVSPNGALRVKRAGKGMKVFLFGNWMDADYRPDDSFGLSAHILGIKLPLSILDEISLSVESRDGADHLALRARGIILGVAEKAVEADVDPAWLARSGTWTPIGPAAKERRDLYIMKLVVGRDKVTGLFGMTVDMAGQKSSYPAASRGARELYLLGHGRNLGSTVTAIERDGEEMLEVYGITFKKANR